VPLHRLRQDRGRCHGGRGRDEEVSRWHSTLSVREYCVTTACRT
jgi:hypothetical protein